MEDIIRPCYPRVLVFQYLQTFHKWLPDGSRVLFNAGPDIYTVDAAGSRTQKIVDTSGEIRFDDAGHDRFGTMTAFDISPDGSKLVYSTCRYPTPPEVEYQFAESDPYFVHVGDGVYIPHRVAEMRRHSFEIAISNIDGTDPKRLTENNAFDNYPVWSPDGGRIAFISKRSTNRFASPPKLYTMAADGSDVRLLYSEPAGSPVWSPDGRHIAFVGVGGVHTVRPDGSDLTTISATRSGPAWSPDGRRLALVAPDGDGAALYTFAYDGSDPVRVTRIIDDASQMVELGYRSLGSFWVDKVSEERLWVRSVVWSPRGSEVLVGQYVVDLESPGTLSQIDLGTYADDSLEKALLGRQDRAWYLHNVRTAWSPDGSAITATVAGGQPYIIDRSAANLRVLPSVSSRARGVAARIASCSGGYVVAEPESNPGLVRDCETLMGLRDSLAGEALLNWSQSTLIEYWYGVEVGGSLPRVTALRLERLTQSPASLPKYLSGLASARALGRWGLLTGSIPAELGNLTKLEVLVLPDNQLTGIIPAELGNLLNLEELNLSDNKLTGSIPTELGKLPMLRIVNLRNNELEGCITLSANRILVCG